MMNMLPELNKEQRTAFEKVHKFDCAQLKDAKARLEQAKKDVEYWQHQVDASSTVALRVSLSNL